MARSCGENDHDAHTTNAALRRNKRFLTLSCRTHYYVLAMEAMCLGNHGIFGLLTSDGCQGCRGPKANRFSIFRCAVRQGFAPHHFMAEHVSSRSRAHQFCAIPQVLLCHRSLWQARPVGGTRVPQVSIGTGQAAPGCYGCINLLFSFAAAMEVQAYWDRRSC